MGLFNAYVALSGSGGIDLLQDEPLSRHTSYRIGGTADLFATCNSVSALMRCIATLNREGIAWTVLGRGTNVLASDDGYRGCIITLGGEFARVGVTEGDCIVAGAGISLAKVVSKALEAGLTGLEDLVGIPGTVGGAIAMDAGTSEEWIGTRVRDLVVLLPNGSLRRYQASDIQWGYRSTSIPSDEVVLEVTLQLAPGDESQISQHMQRRLSNRRRTQPLGRATCGSVFKNPEGDFAARLIQGLGLKGYAQGAACVSNEHANFIINLGGATAADVIAVMTHVHDEVMAAHGIDLDSEVRLLGFSS